MKTRLLFCAVLALAAQAADTLRIMTFNVRMPSRRDGANVWENRRDILAGAIREYRPDIVGTQELFYEQGRYIAARLPEYTWFGRSRRGNHEDEHMGVFYRKDRFKLIESGDFWLSETPDVPGSMSWDVTLPRMVTWALFETGGRKFYYYNTHFPHRAEDAAARRKCAELIAARIRALPAGVPLILTGDFNANAGSDPYQALAAAGLRDAWKEAPEHKGPEGTFHGFSGKPGGSRIDWILYRGPFHARASETVTRNEGGRYPSDHFPVFTVLQWR